MELNSFTQHLALWPSILGGVLAVVLLFLYLGWKPSGRTIAVLGGLALLFGGTSMAALLELGMLTASPEGSPTLILVLVDLMAMAVGFGLPLARLLLGSPRDSG